MVTVLENQFGFMSRRSAVEVTYLMRILGGNYRKNKNGLHIVFIDLKKSIR